MKILKVHTDFLLNRFCSKFTLGDVFFEKLYKYVARWKYFNVLYCNVNRILNLELYGRNCVYERCKKQQQTLY
jgi:hypothetical protein